MPAYRFFKKEDFECRKVLTLEGDECHHLKNVMRHKEGDLIEIINGVGGLAFAEIMEIKKHHAKVIVVQTEFFPKKYDIILLQAAPKIHKLELIVEKGTELGMTELHLFKGDKSELKLSEEKRSRLELKAIAALKQSGRFYCPIIRAIPPIKSWKDFMQPAYYGDVRPESPPLYKELKVDGNSSAFYFCCGPEAGFSDGEVKSLKEKNFKGVSLHTNVLRAETAPLVFLGLIHHYLLFQGDSPVIN